MASGTYFKVSIRSTLFVMWNKKQNRRSLVVLMKKFVPFVVFCIKFF